MDDDARRRDGRRLLQVERHRLRVARSRCRRSAACRATDTGCAANRPASSASARSRSSRGAAGRAARRRRDRPHRRARLRRSRPSSCRRATTPDRSRRASRSRASAPARTTSRRRPVGRRSSAPGWCPRGSAASSARCRRARCRLPSGDQVGVPGCGSESWILVTVPVATSRTDICATRHMPSTLKNTMRLPSGDQDAPCGCVVSCVTLRLCAALHVADPELQVRRCPCPTSRRAACRRATTPDRYRAPRSFVMFTGLAADRHDVDVADRRERDLRAVRRDHRPDDAEHLARRRRREIAHAVRVFRDASPASSP